MSQRDKVKQELLATLVLAIAFAWLPSHVAHAVELHDGLVGYWAFDDAAGNTAAESFGATMDVGELRNEPLWLNPEEAKLGESALWFDGLTTDVLVPPSSDLDIGTAAVSLSAWVNLDELPSELDDSFAGIYDSFGDNYVAYLDKSNQELRFKVTDEDGTAERPGIPESLLSVGSWGHVLGVYDGSEATAKIYFNGTLIDSHANADLNGLVLPGQIASIGANTTTNPDVPVSRFFPGAIDDVAVWNRALGVAEAEYLFNSGTGNAVGMANPDIEPVSEVVVITPMIPAIEPVVHLSFDGNLSNQGTGGADFDGFLLDTLNVNDALFTPSENGQALDLRENPISSSVDGDGVVVDYVMTDSGTVLFDYTVGEYYNFQSLWTNSVDANDWEMWIYSDGRVRGRVDGNSFAEFNLEDFGGVDDTYQIAFTWERDSSDPDNVAVKIFVDGEQQDQDLIGTFVEPGDSVFIGGGDGINHFGNGVFDEFRIYEDALSAGELLYLFSGLEEVCTSSPDINGNGVVDFPDFLILSANFSTEVDSGTMGDLDCSGIVDFPDFLTLSASFGQSVNASGAAATVPEPATFSLCLAFGILAGRLRRRRS